MEAEYITEQNKLASSGSWIWLLEITTTGYQSIRYTNNNTAVEWNEEQWISKPFTADDVSMSTSGEFPEFRLQIDEVSLSSALRTRVRNIDGLIGNTARFRIVHSSHLDLDTPAIDEAAEILSCEVTAQSVIFVLGLPNMMRYRFPRDRYVPGFCRHRFKGGLCKYDGLFTACDHTLESCVERNNSINYGGSPGIVGGVYG